MPKIPVISQDPIVGMLHVKDFQHYNRNSSRGEQLRSASLPRHIVFDMHSRDVFPHVLSTSNILSHLPICRFGASLHFPRLGFVSAIG